MDKKTGYKIAFPVIFIILGIWIGGWFFSLTPEISQFTNQPVNDVFNSLNALFAGLAFGGVIITVYLQIEELKDTREELSRTSEANQMMAADSKEKAVLDLYQTFCSEYFQTIKSYSMMVLIGCVRDKRYCDFVVSRLFVVGQLPFDESFYDSLNDIFQCESVEDFKKEEQKARFKLDELVNFFSILTFKVNSKDIIKNCDFFYAWWRPLFWLVAITQKQWVRAHPEIKHFHDDFNFLRISEALDLIYEAGSFNNDGQALAFIKNHPKIMSYGWDDQHEHG